jgi:hypothetical protein
MGGLLVAVCNTSAVPLFDIFHGGFVVGESGNESEESDESDETGTGSISEDRISVNGDDGTDGAESDGCCERVFASSVTVETESGMVTDRSVIVTTEEKCSVTRSPRSSLMTDDLSSLYMRSKLNIMYQILVKSWSYDRSRDTAVAYCIGGIQLGKIPAIAWSIESEINDYSPFHTRLKKSGNSRSRVTLIQNN